MNDFQIEGSITFNYYQNLAGADDFYGNILGLEKVTDHSWVKIFRLTQAAHVGLTDETKGSLENSPVKPVMLSLVVTDVDAWYAHLTAKGVKANHEPRDSDSPHMRGFMITDPEGYTIEILKFLSQPHGFPQKG